MAILDKRGPRFRQSGIRIGFRRRGRSRQACEISAETSDVVVGEVRRGRELIPGMELHAERGDMRGVRTQVGVIKRRHLVTLLAG